MGAETQRVPVNPESQAKTMRAMRIRAFGDPGAFVAERVPLPVPETGEVRVRVLGSSVNPIDCKVRSGVLGPVVTLPAILHGDVAGVVDLAGPGVSDWQMGAAVCAFAGGMGAFPGALAEYMVVDQTLLARVPASVPVAEAGAIPAVAITAWEAVVVRAQIRTGQKVLVHAGTGGVGHLAAQLARWRGAEVFCTVSSDAKAAVAQTLGVAGVINYRRESVADYVTRCTGGTGFDVVIDTVGGANLDASFQAAAVHGIVVTTAARSTRDLTPLHQKGLTLHVVFIFLPLLTCDTRRRKEQGRALAAVTDLIADGSLKLLRDERRFSFEEVADAHRYLESGAAVGKICLTGWRKT